MDAVRLLARAQEWTGAIVAGVRDEDMQRPTPCTDWDVATLLDHLTADLDTFNRVTSDEGVDLVASIDPTAPENARRAQPDPSDEFARLAKESQEIWGRPGALEQTYKTSRSEVPGNAIVMIALVDTLVHGWDLAKATRPGRRDAARRRGGCSRVHHEGYEGPAYRVRRSGAGPGRRLSDGPA